MIFLEESSKMPEFAVELRRSAKQAVKFVRYDNPISKQDTVNNIYIHKRLLLQDPHTLRESDLPRSVKVTVSWEEGITKAR